MSERPEDVEPLDLDAIARRSEYAHHVLDQLEAVTGDVARSALDVRPLLTEVQRLRGLYRQADKSATTWATRAMVLTNERESAVQEARKLWAALEDIERRATPKDWETPGHPMNDWTSREPILRVARAALAVSESETE